MARSKKAVPADGEAQLVQENAQLRAMLDSQTQAHQAVISRLAAVAPAQRVSTTELVVGVRNISDNTVGVRSPFAGEPDLHLHADVPGVDSDPSRVAVISYAWWQQLRKSRMMEQGLIMRDDSILGNSYQAAPEDRPSDIAPGWTKNAVINPEAWIESFASEPELRAAIDAMTSEPSLRRVRGVVDRKLKEIERQYPTDPNRAKKAVRALPALYQMLDQVITTKLESGDDDEE